MVTILEKRSHDQFAKRYFLRINRPILTLDERMHYLDLANDRELHGAYDVADNLRRVALGLPIKLKERKPDAGGDESAAPGRQPHAQGAHTRG